MDAEWYRELRDDVKAIRSTQIEDGKKLAVVCAEVTAQGRQLDAHDEELAELSGVAHKVAAQEKRIDRLQSLGGIVGSIATAVTGVAAYFGFKP